MSAVPPVTASTPAARGTARRSRLALRSVGVAGAVVGAVVAAGGALAAPAFAATPYHVAVHTNHASIDVGQSVRIGGRVTGGPVSRRSVLLYWTRSSEEDTWHRLGTARLSAHGYFRRSYRPAFGGDIAFRAVKTAVGSHHRGSAVSEATEVFEWQSLWRYNFGAADAMEGTARIHGTSYPDSLLLSDAQEAGFVTYGCKAVRGLVGEVDSSTADSGTVTIENEGALVAGVSAGWRHDGVNIVGALDTADALSVTGSISGGAGPNQVALARPQVMCNAPA